MQPGRISAPRRNRPAACAPGTRAGHGGPSSAAAVPLAPRHAVRCAGCRSRAPLASARRCRNLPRPALKSMPRHGYRLCRHQPFATRKRRSCPTGTSRKIGSRTFDAHARRLEIDIGQPRHGQGFRKATGLSRLAADSLRCKAAHARAAPVGDEHGSRPRRPFRSGDVLIEFSAGEGCDGHDKSPNVVMILHFQGVCDDSKLGHVAFTGQRQTRPLGCAPPRGSSSARSWGRKPLFRTLYLGRARSISRWAVL